MPIVRPNDCFAMIADGHDLGSFKVCTELPDSTRRYLTTITKSNIRDRLADRTFNQIKGNQIAYMIFGFADRAIKDVDVQMMLLPLGFSAFAEIHFFTLQLWQTKFTLFIGLFEWKMT